MRKSLSSRSLYRLIYCSRNVIMQAIPGADPGYEMDTIRDSARRRNATANVTGALLFSASGFAQVLEGPREVVEATFDRISCDPRHTDVTVLSFTPALRRSFPAWAMGLSGQMADPNNDPLIAFLSDAAQTGPRATTGTDVLRLLEQLVQREDQALKA